MPETKTRPPDMQATTARGKPSQTLIPLRELRDGVVVMQDGTLRAVLMVSSVNFALKSEEEQNALVYAYQDFLNSLDFPMQILVSSRKADITPYLAMVRERRDRQKNELLRLQMAEYINFVEELVKNSNIMTKTFYVVVPFAIEQETKRGLVTRLLAKIKFLGGKALKMNDAEFLHNRAQLFQRVEQVAVGLRGLGLRLAPLQTEELLELFYTFYNPNSSRTQRLRLTGQLDVREARRV